MPYNYPVIVQLLEEYKNDPRVRNGGNWRARFDRYVEAMPPYYLTPLRNALTKMKMESSLLDERGVSLSQVYPAALLNYLNDLKTQGKEEFEKTCTTLSVLLQQNMAPLPIIHLCEPRVRAPAGCRFRNPFIVPALEMVGELPRLRANLDMTLRENTFAILDGGPPGVDLKLHNSDELHQLPIAQMGNYEEYIKGLAAVGRGPLRPVEPTPVRTHAFGNPFKTDKKSLAIDEVGEGPVGANAAVPTTKESRRERVKGEGIELAGLEPEAESADEEEEEDVVAPPPKRRKTERLSEEQMFERKLRIAQIVRRHANNGTVWTDLCRETSANGSLLDQLDLADFALRDSRRFKRRALADQLTAEMQRIRKLLAM
ncbi:hypothetical protein TELCIR_01867 [Teladorsagia circumcincta]|uniref:Uncharacterized protein n=1 Tax=Teladorsagia circumcincta TaxID=45464 RepID=A0A2G9V282_TELCI|nr:hypothetical protein TELCIR_01867 [Teladorsagia circumcincta]